MILILLLATFSLNAQTWSGIVDASRAANWAGVGISGGIPARTTICSTLTSSATAANIESAISGCTAGQVVYLSAGTYNLSAGITFGAKSNVTLRGAGADQTFLVFSNDDSCHGASSSICIDSSDTNWKGGTSNSATWSAGYTKGTTTITLSSVTNLKVGNPLILDQLDDATAPCDDGSIIISASSTACASATSPGSVGPFSLEGNGGGAQRSGRQQTQIVTVASCDGNSTIGHACSSGTNITISPGLYMPNWSSGKTPQAWWSTSPIQYSGIENLSLDHTNAGSSTVGIEMWNCVGCFVKGVRSINSGRAHVRLEYSTRAIIRDSYFFLTQNSVSQSYGFECYSGADSLVENNIFQAVAAPEMINGNCSGTVVAYNFSINNYYTGSSRYNASANNQHTAGIDNLLFEGNYGNAVYGDVFHGTHHFVTYFRNRWTGPQPACWQSGSTYAGATFNTCTSNLGPVQLQSFTRFFNFVGNILGTTGTNTTYGNVWDLGSGNSNGTVTVPSDANVATTLMRWGNCDSATGFGSCKFDSSEVPSALSGTQAVYSNAVPGSTTLPASFYYSSTPSWWPSGKAWPPIGPDVSGGNVVNVSGHAYTIPAQDCFLSTMGGPSDGTGAVLSFNANTCYAVSGVTSFSGTVTEKAVMTGKVAVN